MLSFVRTDKDQYFSRVKKVSINTKKSFSLCAVGGPNFLQSAGRVQDFIIWSSGSSQGMVGISWIIEVIDRHVSLENRSGEIEIISFSARLISSSAIFGTRLAGVLSSVPFLTSFQTVSRKSRIRFKSSKKQKIMNGSSASRASSNSKMLDMSLSLSMGFGATDGNSSYAFRS